MTASVLIALVILGALAMALTSMAWAKAFAASFWLVLIRPKYSLPLLATYALATLAWTAGLDFTFHRILAATAAVLGCWTTPFLAVPLLNGLARWRDKERTKPLPLTGSKPRLGSYVFDSERARQTAAYQPPPVH